MFWPGNHDKSEILLLGNHGYTVQEDKSVPGNLGPFDLFVHCFKTRFDDFAIFCTPSFLPDQDLLPVLCVISYMIGALTHSLLVTLW